jgi:hypothetical protein
MECPKCGSPPRVDIKALDGGSSICSKCSTHFHICKKTCAVSTESPIDCCYSITKQEAIDVALKGCKDCKLVPTLEMINSKEEIQVCYNNNCLNSIILIDYC